MSNTKFETGHIGLNVKDLENSINFYQKIFGFEIMGKSDNPEKAFAFLGKDGNLLITLWQQSENDFSKNTSGLHHLSFQVDSIEEVKKAESLIKAAGGKFHYDGIVPHREGQSSGGIFFEDPDGIRLEIYSPTDANENEAPSGDAPTCGFF